ncbi:MAG TPA: glycosyltransferase [Anaeromyxobacteraceae bacterium]|jgi:glycosyltransferase involved in cell wall biosynthesis|nr:glycosyltransferase [Anaeromyxobacteraceae bacterium]
MRVLHVITGLNLGGAEVMLHRLLQASARVDGAQEVVSLTDLGPVAERIKQLGIPTLAVGMRRAPTPARLMELTRLIRAFQPDVVQTWMYHADLLGGLCARAAGRAPIAWGIHNNALDPGSSRRTTYWTVAACARLSRSLPDRIVCVSRAARDLHVAKGYDAGKMVVIPNGFDLEQFRPDQGEREALRTELGVEPSQLLVGLIARVDPQKDHLTFIRAAALLARRRREARFLLCGEGTAATSGALADAIAEAGLADRFHLLGRREDVRRVLNALDLCTLCSTSEAFPLVLGEAMACGLPCVATEVGDCAYLLGDAGRVVPPRDPAALARGWEELLALGAAGRRRLGLAARARIEAGFGISRIAALYLELYRGLAASHPGRPLAGAPTG